MLSLVEYDNSDSEDENISSYENENKDSIDTPNACSGAVEILATSNEEDGKLGDIFELLPQPHLNIVSTTEEEDDEFLKKKEVPTEKPKRLPIKINVPSLSEFDSDDDEAPAKKPKIHNKSCGLFSLLPQPKGTAVTTKDFIPNAVKKNAKRVTKPPKKITATVHKQSNKEKQMDVVESDDDEDVMKDLPDTFDDEIWQKVCGKKEKRVSKPIMEETVESNKIIQLDPDVKKPYEGLDNKAFKELLGAANKRKEEVIDIVEINEDEILSDKKIWMTKSITDPEMAPKYVVKNPVNDTCRRKHHITYLAEQAKANEQELQNQWAASRFTRQKTQAKYGF